MYCPNCRESNADGVRICEKCGHFLPLSPDEIPWLLTGLSGPVEGRSFQIEKSVNIGRARECDVAVLDAGVSRNHARIERAREGLVLADLGSSNGRRIRGPVPLLPGDVIRVGRSELSIDIGTIATAPPKERVPTVAPAQTEPTVLLRGRNGLVVGEEAAGSPSRRRLLFRSCLILLIVIVCAAVALAAGYTMVTRDDDPPPPSQSATDTLVQVRHGLADDWSGDVWTAPEASTWHSSELQPGLSPADAVPLLKRESAAVRAGTNVRKSVREGNAHLNGMATSHLIADTPRRPGLRAA